MWDPQVNTIYRGKSGILTFTPWSWTTVSWSRLVDERLAKRTGHAVSTFNFSLEDVESLCALVVRPSTISTRTTPRTTAELTTSSGGSQTMKAGIPTVRVVIVAHCLAVMIMY